jgi:endoglucanase
MPLDRRTLLKRSALAAPSLILAGRSRAGIAIANGVGLFGVNISGPEFNPSQWQQTSPFPATSDWSYLGSKGVPFVRLCIAWESLQPSLDGTLNPNFLSEIKSAIKSAHAMNVGVILNLHNFGCYCDSDIWNDGSVGYAGNAGTIISGVSYFGDGILTPTVFANLWSQLAQALHGSPGLIGYGLMNEPGPWNFYYQPGQSWFGRPPHLSIATLASFYQAAVDAIRFYDLSTTIYMMLPDGAVVAGQGSSVNDALTHFPSLISSVTGANLTTEWHIYFDSPPGAYGGSGNYSSNYASYDESSQGGVTDISPYVTYCKNNNVSGFVGEYAWPNDSTVAWQGGQVGQWMTLGTNLLNYLVANKIRATWWNYASLTRFIGSPLTVNPRRGLDDPRLLVMLSIGNR